MGVNEIDFGTTAKTVELMDSAGASSAPALIFDRREMMPQSLVWGD